MGKIYSFKDQSKTKGRCQLYTQTIYLRIIKNIHQRIMISKQLIQHITQIRRTDNVNIFFIQDCSTQLNSYFDIDGTNILNNYNSSSRYSLFHESHLIYFPPLRLIQESERLQFKSATKFLAKKYFDIFVSKYPRFMEQNPILGIITCLRTAAKVILLRYPSLIKFRTSTSCIRSITVWSNLLENIQNNSLFNVKFRS